MRQRPRFWTRLLWLLMGLCVRCGGETESEYRTPDGDAWLRYERCTDCGQLW